MDTGGRARVINVSRIDKDIYSCTLNVKNKLVLLQIPRKTHEAKHVYHILIQKWYLTPFVRLETAQIVEMCLYSANTSYKQEIIVSNSTLTLSNINKAKKNAASKLL